MDVVVGTEYYSKRGWAPNGDFRYKGPGLDHVIARWNALLDRGIEGATPGRRGNGPAATNGQSGEPGRRRCLPARAERTLSPDTRVAGAIEYLSSYVYRLVFDDNYSQAISSEVASDVVLTHEHNWLVPSVWLDRFQSFARTTNGNEVKILRLPSIRYDVLDRPIGKFAALLGAGIVAGIFESLRTALPLAQRGPAGFLSAYLHALQRWRLEHRSRGCHARYGIHDQPDSRPDRANTRTPTISHDPLDRKDIEARSTCVRRRWSAISSCRMLAS